VCLFLRCDATESLPELGVMHTFDVLGELHDILGFFAIDLAQQVEKQLMLVRPQGVEELAPSIGDGLFQALQIVFCHVFVLYSAPWRPSVW
jgi:hypothetical protein